MQDTITQLYEKFRKPLLYYILKNVANKSVAEDLLHEVFIKAFQKFDSLDDKEKIQSWLYKITSNTIIDYFRKKELGNVEDVDVFSNEVVKQSVISELDCCLKAFMDKLPTNQKEVLTAVYFEELSLVEYAKEENLNLSTVKSHAKRAKEKLKNVFQECCSFEKNGSNEIVDFKHKNRACKC